MARKSTELKAVSYIIVGNAPPVRFDSLTEEKKAETIEAILDRISRLLSEYASNNPQELKV